MKRTLQAVLLLSWLYSPAQVLTTNRDKIEASQKQLTTAFDAFQECIVSGELENCLITLEKKATDDYKKYTVAGLLYDIDRTRSFKLHKEAYEHNQSDLNFTLEYAIELHRNGNYKEAALLYEKYLEAMPNDFRANVWLADCYSNTNETGKAFESWSKLNFPNNHTGTDFALFTIYGDTGQLKKRDDYKKRIKKGETCLAYSLVFMDINWKYDWWNSDIQENLLAEDIRFIESILNKNQKDLAVIKAYVKIKRVASDGAAVEKILKDSAIIINGKLLPNGEITSDILRICFVNNILSEKDFYKARGTELLASAKKNKDAEMLNIYAYLQATVNGKVDTETDKLGWLTFNDERFAVSYFMGKAAANRYDDKELAQALADFPQSSKLLWVKLNCAVIEGKPHKELLAEIIKKEFRTLGSTPDHYSYALNDYIGLLHEQN